MRNKKDMVGKSLKENAKLPVFVRNYIYQNGQSIEHFLLVVLPLFYMSLYTLLPTSINWLSYALLSTYVYTLFLGKGLTNYKSSFFILHCIKKGDWLQVAHYPYPIKLNEAGFFGWIDSKYIPDCINEEYRAKFVKSKSIILYELVEDCKDLYHGVSNIYNQYYDIPIEDSRMNHPRRVYRPYISSMVTKILTEEEAQAMIKKEKDRGPDPKVLVDRMKVDPSQYTEVQAIEKKVENEEN
jgi:hypothetical protein